MTTTLAKIKDIKRKWHLLDASGQTLGRLSTRVAGLLSGRLKADWTPHIDSGDFVVVINAKDIKVTGKKLEQKKYYHYSGYPGGITETSLAKLMSTRPEEVIRHAVLGMLPKNKQRANFIKRLKVYAGAEHPHEAQLGEK